MSKISRKEQVVNIDIKDKELTPEVIVIQEGVETRWKIKNTDNKIISLAFPIYNQVVDIDEGENEIYLIPNEDFIFDHGKYNYFSYVKVVEDINNINMD